MPPLRPLLICSIGNPSSTYAHTLHSAGHTVLDSIQALLGRSAWTPFLGGAVSRDVPAGIGQLTLTGWKRRAERPADERDWTLWKSGSLMNVSGAGVARAWRQWAGEEERRRRLGRLVVLHDEMEREFGTLRVVEGSASARGHNGVKSIQAHLGAKTEFKRIGIGIGRPTSRDPLVVSRYVLRKMTSGEKRVIEKTADEVIALLAEMEEGVG